VTRMSGQWAAKRQALGWELPAVPDPPSYVGMCRYRAALWELFRNEGCTLQELKAGLAVFASYADGIRAQATQRTSKAALVQAEASASMARTLAAHEHGGAALLMLSRLQEGLAEGTRRPLPGRVRPLAEPTP